MSSQAQRPKFYDGQYLGADDLTAAVDYGRLAGARHALGGHTWGIALGLDLNEAAAPAGGGEVDVSVQPGFAWDGFGRPILVLTPCRLPLEKFKNLVYDGAIDEPNGRPVEVWIRHQEVSTRAARAGFEACQVEDQTSRIQESFQIEVGARARSEQHDKVSVGGRTVDADQVLTGIDPAFVLADESVPFQSFPAASQRALWLVPIGKVRYRPNPNPTLPGAFRTSDPADIAASQALRRCVGVVAAEVRGPQGIIRMQDRRAAPAAVVSNDLVWVEGDLRVDKDAKLFGGRLSFRDAAGQEPGGKLWMQRRPSGGGAVQDLRVHIGADASANRRLTVGPGPDDGSNEKTVLAVKADDTVDIPTGTLNFGSQVRQMVNLWSTEYALGVQAGTLYERSAGDFAWFKDGAHNDARLDPGGGTLQMHLDDQGRLHFESRTRQMLNLWSTQYGIGVQASTLYFRTATDFCWFRGGAHSDTRSDPGAGGALAMKLDDTLRLAVSGALTTGGNAIVGTGTDAVLKVRHVAGKSWNSDNDDHLYLNWGTGQDVHVGNEAAVNSSLHVAKDMYLRGVKVPVDVMSGDVHLHVEGNDSGTETVRVTSRLASVSGAAFMVALSDIRNVDTAVNARWRVHHGGLQTRVNANTFDFTVTWQVDDSDGWLEIFSWVAIFTP